MSRSKIASVDSTLCENKKSLLRAIAHFTQRSVPIITMVVPFMAQILPSNARGTQLRRRLEGNDSASLYDTIDNLSFVEVKVPDGEGVNASSSNGKDTDPTSHEINLHNKDVETTTGRWKDAGMEYYNKLFDYARQIHQRKSLSKQIEQLHSTATRKQEELREKMHDLIDEYFARIHKDRKDFYRMRISNLTGTKTSMNMLDNIYEALQTSFNQRTTFWNNERDCLNRTKDEDLHVMYSNTEIEKMQKEISEYEKDGDKSFELYEKIQGEIVEQNRKDKAEFERREWEIVQRKAAVARERELKRLAREQAAIDRDRWALERDRLKFKKYLENHQ